MKIAWVSKSIFGYIRLTCPILALKLK